MPGEFDEPSLKSACNKVETLTNCHSVNKVPIFHYEKTGSLSKTPDSGKKIIVLSLIHGDERESGSVARRWMSRLEKLDSRNSWRIIPVVNPDGWAKNTRTNGQGVDLNRNFPSKDWHSSARKLWKSKRGGDPRRNPGITPASEPETRCLLAHLNTFEPDFVIAIHTPYGVLDYDGPNVPLPKFSDIPWVKLGTFPGSLGRYMWVDKNIPVLTVELKGSEILTMVDKIDRLQDIGGTVAIRTNEILNSDSK